MTESSGENKISIVRGALGSLSVYEITDYELDRLEQGTSNPILLNFAILALSSGIAFLIAVTTAEISEDRIYYLFWIFSVLGVFIGVLLLAIWFRTRTRSDDICKKIRDRMPSYAVVETAKSDIASITVSSSETEGEAE